MHTRGIALHRFLARLRASADLGLSWALSLLAALLVLVQTSSGVAGEPHALQTVVPAIPGQNNVRWWQFDWRYVDLQLPPGGAPFRLYYYESEQAVAARAIPDIAQAYAELAERLAYVPSRPVTLHLYNSHFEFETLAGVHRPEALLGVTREQDRSVSLPYWGEEGRFRHVLWHELAHQFVLQKLADVGKQADCNAESRMPAWFIEGASEYLSLPALTPEARAAIAGRFVSPTGLREQDTLPGFYDDGPHSFQRLYLFGQAQVRFLEERFGKGTVERLLAQSGGVCKLGPRLFLRRTDTALAGLVTQVTGLDADAVDREWRQWARAQVASQLKAEKPAALVQDGDLGTGEIDSVVLSPNGQFMLYRTYQAESGTGRLFLQHIASGKRVQVAADHQLGLVSLHPLGRRVIALGSDSLAYVGRRGATDRIFVRHYRFEDGDFELSSKTIHDVADVHDLIEAGDPAIDPGTGAVAFVGLDRKTGALDVFRVEQPDKSDSPVTRLTNDAYAEQGLAYAGETLWLSTDATPDARFALSRLEDGKVAPALALGSPADAINAGAAGPFGLVFQCDPSGLWQACVLFEGKVVRVSDLATGITSPAIDSSTGDLFGVALIDGTRRLVRLPHALWTGEAVTSAAVSDGSAWQAVSARVPPAEPYHARDLSNWRLLTAIAAVGSGPSAFLNVRVADMFRTNELALRGNYIGHVEQGNAELIYMNHGERLGRGLRLFFSTGEQLARPEEYHLLRTGADGVVSWQLGQYVRIDGALGILALRAGRFEGFDVDVGKHNGTVYAAGEAGLAFGLDTLRLAPVGPFKGTAFTLRALGVAPFTDVKPLGSVQLDLNQYFQIAAKYNRLFLRGRLAGGMSSHNPYTEQFYLPASYNLRGFSETSKRLIGEDFALATAELHFPLAPRFRETLFLQGIVGADVGAIGFSAEDLWDRRIGDAVAGVGVVFAPIIVRGLFALPFSVGAGRPVDDPLFHLTVAAPLFGFF